MIQTFKNLPLLEREDVSVIYRAGKMKGQRKEQKTRKKKRKEAVKPSCKKLGIRGPFMTSNHSRETFLRK